MDIFIIGCKGIPANYGGYETFVEQLTLGKQNDDIKYHVACRTNKKSEDANRFEYNNADCFKVYVPNVGPAQAILYDMKSVRESVNYSKIHKIKDPIFYILGCSMGPGISQSVRLIHNINGRVYINPDGHEWMRAKWNYFVRRYLRYSEKIMIRKSDLIICDSDSIEKYVNKTYKKYAPNTIFIAYGATVENSKLEDHNLKVFNWLSKNNLTQDQYYLIVGRFVPENNYETMITEFMKSETRKDLVIITNYAGNKYFQDLKQRTKFDKDKRIKFVGTVYDAELLKKIRELSFGYLHGHSVGGTNPSLLEAMSSTKLNLLYNVGFNHEVAQDSAFYWTLEAGDLSHLINEMENISPEEIDKFDKRSTDRIINSYSWEKIIYQYEKLFFQQNYKKSLK